MRFWFVHDRCSRESSSSLSKVFSDGLATIWFSAVGWLDLFKLSIF
jgi:hypothetical protein